MSSNGESNGLRNGSSVQDPLTLVPVESSELGQTSGAAPSTTSRFDPKFTDAVINATGPKATPRVRKVIASLTRHMHDFARENEITVDEWMAAVNLMNEAGKMSDDRRNEGQLMMDILGMETLVDEITYKLASEAADQATASAILGPFWRKDAPAHKMGESIVMNGEKRGLTFMHGVVTDVATGKPVAQAELDVWHTAPNGLYEQQDPDQPDMNLRGRFTTGSDGKYSFYCLRPVPYPIPTDGPSNTLLQLLDRHPMRPAHIHFIISAPGYKPLVTQIFDRNDEYIANDTVFAVKDSLIVDFVPTKDDPNAEFDLKYDFQIVSYDGEGKGGGGNGTASALPIHV